MFFDVPYVIEKSSPNGHEKSYSLSSRLLKDRIIMLVGEVEEQLATAVSGQLMYLDNQCTDKPIIMFINSPGGSVTDGLAIYDTMNFIDSKIVTVGFGQCCSMGSFLLSMGDTRLSMPSTSLMYHSVSSGFYGTVHDHAIQFEETMRLQKVLFDKLSAKVHSEYSAEFNERIKRDFYILPEDAQKFGLIDAVIPNKAAIKGYL